MRTQHPRSTQIALALLIALASIPVISPAARAQQAGALKMAAPLEAGIVCMDLDRMLEFYTKTLGLTLVADAQTTPEMSTKLGVTPDGYRIVRLQTPNGERLKLVQAKHRPNRNPDPQWVFDRQGLAYITFVVSDLNGLFVGLKAQSVSFVGAAPVEVRKGLNALMARDPEGNFVEFVEYDDIASYRPDLIKKR